MVCGNIDYVVARCRGLGQTWRGVEHKIFMVWATVAALSLKEQWSFFGTLYIVPLLFLLLYSVACAIHIYGVYVVFFILFLLSFESDFVNRSLNHDPRFWRAKGGFHVDVILPLEHIAGLPSNPVASKQIRMFCERYLAIIALVWVMLQAKRAHQNRLYFSIGCRRSSLIQCDLTNVTDNLTFLKRKRPIQCTKARSQDRKKNAVNVLKNF